MHLKFPLFIPFVLVLSIFTLLFTASCTHTPGDHKEKTGQSNTNYQAPKKPGSSFTDSILINNPSAVFYNPDSIQLEKIKAITDTPVFNSIMHEFFYQQRNAHIVLKKYYPWLSIVQIKNARYIIFKMSSGLKEKIDLDLKSDACGLYIFDGNKPPQLVDMTNIDSQLSFYFGEK